MKQTMNRQQAIQLFNSAENKKKQLNFVPKVFQENLHFMEYKIRKQTKSFTILNICGGDRNNFSVDAGFQRAFQSMNFQEKVIYYHKSINFASQSDEREDQLLVSKRKIQNESIKLTIAIAKGFKWEEASIQLKDFKAISDFKIDLRNYLLRKSKKKDKHCYVLEAIKKLSPETIRFAFLSDQDYKRFFPLIKEKVDLAHKQTVDKILSEAKVNRKVNNKNLGQTNAIKLKVSEVNEGSNGKIERVSMPIESQSPVQIELKSPRLKTSLSQSICEEMLKDKDSQDLDDELQDLIDKQNQEMEQKLLKEEDHIKEKPKYYKNIFKIVFPTYSLNQLSTLHHYKTVYQSPNSNLFIYHSTKNAQVYKMQMKVQLSAEVVCLALHNFNLQKIWHPQVAQGHIKMKITSQNSCIGYNKIKALNEWYRQRDYVFLMHLFKFKNSYYLISKSIQNTNFIPFPSIIRGNINFMIWRITELNNICSISMNTHIQYGGLLNNNQKQQLALKYLKGFQNMELYFLKKQNRDKLSKSMGLYWQITDSHQTEEERQQIEQAITYRTCDFQDSGSQIQEQTVFYTINNIEDSEDGFQFLNESKGSIKDGKILKEEQVHQKKEQEIKNQNKKMMMTNSYVYTQALENIVTNEEGLVILPNTYLKKRQPIKPLDTPLKPIKLQYQSKSIVLKDDWVLYPKGQLKLVNKKKMQAQDSVFKFILGTLKKNIFSGKGGLNISLPVYIFNVDSTLQRTCQGLCLAPHLLEKAAKLKDEIERMKYCIAFLLSNSLLYFDVEKPFNPILGETYQGYIGGCPIYAEQISHHPPITSFYFIGRGYKMYGNLEAKVKIHMNSGEGVNWGFYNIIFDDGQKVQFQTPPGELNGLTVGQRGFAVKGKGFCLDPKNNIFCQLKFENDSGFFSKKKWQFNDQIEGQLVKVKGEFIKKFVETEEKKGPEKKDIQEKYYTIGGRWPIQMTFNDEPFYQVNKHLPEKLVDQVNPLNSNSNYRQDLYYRKQEDLDKSQKEKQRLEVIQRNDRKLREKFHGKAQH